MLIIGRTSIEAADKVQNESDCLPHLQNLFLGMPLAGHVQGTAHIACKVKAEKGVCLRQLHAAQHHCLWLPVRGALHLLYGFLDILPILL